MAATVAHSHGRRTLDIEVPFNCRDEGEKQVHCWGNEVLSPATLRRG